MKKEEWIIALQKRHGKEIFGAYSSATVAICGLGGLGSNIATLLARAGIGKLILIDFDRVDATNLNRQQYKANQIGKFKTEALAENIYEIAPFVDVLTRCECITQDNAVMLLEKADVICEAFDSAESKAMLINTVCEAMPYKYIVAASGMAGLGSANSIKTKRITKNLYLSGDEISDVEQVGSLVATRVAICAAHQAHTVLRILAKKFEV